MSMFLRLCVVVDLFILVWGDGYIVNPGPKVIATKGHPWPLPKSWTHESSFFKILPEEFKFVTDHGFQCSILANAVTRYSQIIQQKMKSSKRHRKVKEDWENSVEFHVSEFPGRNVRFRETPLCYFVRGKCQAGNLKGINILLGRSCEEYPHLFMDESYSLFINSSGATLQSPTIWGTLRGLETFSQLIFHSESASHLLINATSITDEPSYPHRGLLLDTSRHFIRPKTIKAILDGMSYNKLNVFHWHIVDDQSFPFVSGLFPELSEKGAYKPEMIYDQATVQEIIEFARMRGIRVIPEFDSPGHTRSWGVSHPELLTKCSGQFEGYYGPMDPTKNNTFHFIQSLFREVIASFHDEFFHLGADEVDFKCWMSNQEVVEYVKEQGYNGDYKKLQDEFVGKVVKIVEEMSVSPIVWEEAFNANLSKEAVVHVWKREDPMGVMQKVTKAGHRAILSTGWYLDRVQFQSDILNYLKNDPRGFQGSDEQKKLVLGGEACMWSELVDDDNVLQRIFSRVGATAERLWSHDFSDLNYALQRIEEHNCRLRERGLKTQPPNGPGFC